MPSAVSTPNIRTTPHHLGDRLGFRSQQQHPHLASRGKTGGLVSCGAAILCGAAVTLINFFWTVGQAVNCDRGWRGRRRRLRRSPCAGGGRDASGADAGGDDAAVAGAGEVLLVVLGVPAVAQERGGDTGGGDEFLSGLVVGCEFEDRRRSFQARGVDQVRHTGLAGGVDRRAVLRHAVTRAEGDQEQLVGIGERLRCAVQVDGGGAHALGGEFGEAPGVAAEREDVASGATSRKISHSPSGTSRSTIPMCRTTIQRQSRTSSKSRVRVSGHVPVTQGARRDHQVHGPALSEHGDQAQDLARHPGALAGQQVGLVFQRPQRLALLASCRFSTTDRLCDCPNGQVRTDTCRITLHRPSTESAPPSGGGLASGPSFAVPGPELALAADRTWVRVTSAPSVAGVADSGRAVREAPDKVRGCAAEPATRLLHVHGAVLVQGPDKPFDDGGRVRPPLCQLRRILLEQLREPSTPGTAGHCRGRWPSPPPAPVLA